MGSRPYFCAPSLQSNFISETIQRLCVSQDRRMTVRMLKDWFERRQNARHFNEKSCVSNGPKILMRKNEELSTAETQFPPNKKYISLTE